MVNVDRFQILVLSLPSKGFSKLLTCLGVPLASYGHIPHNQGE